MSESSVSVTPDDPEAPFMHAINVNEFSTESLDTASIVKINAVPIVTASTERDGLTESCIILGDSKSLFTEPVESSPPTVEIIQDLNKGQIQKRYNYVYELMKRDYELEFQYEAHIFENTGNNYELLLANKKQTYFSKGKVARIIINHEFKRTASFDISTKQMIELANLTAEVFKYCLPESFFGISDDKGPGGVFNIYYHKQREREIAIHRLHSARNKRKSLDEEDINNGKLQTLKERVAIIDDQYLQIWRTTSVQERFDLYKTSDLKCIFETLPNLTNPSGYLLVQSDYYSLFKKPSDIFMLNWTQVSNKIVSFALKKKDKNIQSIIQQNHPLKGEEHTRNLALILLTHLFNRVTKVTAKSKAKASWKPEKSDVADSFVTHIQDTQNVMNSLQQVQEKLLKIHADHKLMLRPYVVLNGPNLSDIRSAYVIVDQVIYQVVSPTIAVDICFQCMKVFHVPFSCVCNHVWQFIEREVYKHDVARLYSGVVTLIENLMKF